MSYRYKHISCSEMSLEEVEMCSRLFSANYGTWSQKADEKRRGRPVKLSATRFSQLFVEKTNRHIAMMYDGSTLIGQVVYIRCDSPWNPKRKASFVQQLVLDQKYRGHRFGLKMLQSIFGLSNDDAWGLYTSNPFTVRALEDATFRRISVSMIRNRLSGLKSILSDVFDNDSWLDSFRNGCVDTDFPVCHDTNPAKIKKAYHDRPFPFQEQLREGEEYLAVVFRNQQINPESASLGLLTDTSWEILIDAYSKMDMKNQKWASLENAKKEADFLFNKGWVKPGDKVLDLGCGIGRHANELARRGCIVRGIDLSERLIHEARKSAPDENNPTFDIADILLFKPDQKYDVVLCLYDVIGSSIKPEIDAKITKSIARSLKRNGVVVVSVLNLEMTRRFCQRSNNTFHDMHSLSDFKKLINLPPSSTMQTTGEIFKGQFLLLNPITGEVYRKEQFESSTDLPREYVIADKRYTEAGLRDLFKNFVPVETRYVKAGHWNLSLSPNEKHAKEVLGVFRKRGTVSEYLRKLAGMFAGVFGKLNRIP